MSWTSIGLYSSATRTGLREHFTVTLVNLQFPRLEGQQLEFPWLKGQ